MIDKYSKLVISLRYYLIGSKYIIALKALDFARKIHVGKRKDQITNEFQHQIEMGLYVITLKELMNEEDTIACAILHDVVEDYPENFESMNEIFPKRIVDACMLLDNRDKSDNEYYSAIGKNQLASIVKGVDRMHNVGSMTSVFTREKQKEYIEEVELHILPMLKVARDLFPEQILAYYNIITMLRNQAAIIKPLLQELK